ncbi:16548_t:CDS:2 [Racocetra fulgida]|uniref:16548_t:CDS:1 n=1 Tax=Racocetra fulgida TaxID=60492 RepID=A0A9N9A3I9_9GLOM|nr:16548_t:CDS:2 [Racocetra fulgida]
MEPFHQNFSLDDKTIQYPFAENERVPMWLAAVNFINRCDPLPGSVDAKPFGLSNASICQQTDSAIMKDGFKSFISGHSSSFIVLLPLALAAYIAVTRTEDYRHHWQDVVTGGLIGIAGIPLPIRLIPHDPEYKAHFTFEDGTNFEVNVVRNDGSTVLKDTKTFQSATNNDDNEDPHRLV